MAYSDFYYFMTTEGNQTGLSSKSIIKKVRDHQP